MKTSLLTTIILSALLTLVSCNSKSEAAPAKAVEKISSMDQAITADDTSDEVDTDTKELLATEICRLAFADQNSKYFKTSEDKLQFRKFLGSLQLEEKNESCNAFRMELLGINELNINSENENIWLDAFLPYLTNVKNINASGKGLKDLNNLKYINSLRTLNLNNTSASTITTLGRGITLISLENTKITNEIFGKMPMFPVNHYTLLIGNNPQITDLQELGMAPYKISELSLKNNNRIVNFWPISKLKNLETLDLSGTNVKFHDLRDMIYRSGSPIKKLNLSNTEVTVIDDLVEFANLEEVNLKNTLIGDLRGLSGLSKLRVVILSKNQKEKLDLSVLGENVEVREE